VYGYVRDGPTGVNSETCDHTHRSCTVSDRRGYVGDAATLRGFSVSPRTCRNRTDTEARGCPRVKLTDANARKLRYTRCRRKAAPRRVGACKLSTQRAAKISARKRRRRDKWRRFVVCQNPRVRDVWRVPDQVLYCKLYSCLFEVDCWRPVDDRWALNAEFCREMSSRWYSYQRLLLKLRLPRISLVLCHTAVYEYFDSNSSDGRGLFSP